MSAQAEQMKSMVNELVALVDGSSRKSDVAAVAAPEADGEADQNVESAADNASEAPQPSQPTPEQIIPLDEEEFRRIVAMLPDLREHLDRVISHVVPLKQGVEMFHRLAKGEAGMRKVILADAVAGSGKGA